MPKTKRSNNMRSADKWMTVVLALLAAGLLAICVMSIVQTGPQPKTEYASDRQ